MNTSRLLFVRPRLRASLAPIYVALLCLVALGLLAFAVALWPQGTAPLAPQPEARDVSPGNGTPARGASQSRKAGPAPSRGRWA